MKLNSAKILLPLILLLGLSLRITGIQWGLQTSKYFHAASFQPDEADTFNAMKGFAPAKLDFRIKHYLATRGSAQVYLTAAWVKAASLFGAAKVSPSFDYFKANPKQLVKLYLTGRAMSVFFGILTVFMAYLLANLFFKDVRTALLSALILAVTPLHAIWSHYISTDALLAFEVCVLFMVCHGIINDGRLKFYLAAGALVGFIGATKHTAAPVFLVPLLSHILSGRKIFSKDPALYGLACFAGFFAGNPYAFIEPGQFIKTLKWAAEIGINMDPKAQIIDTFGSQPNLIFYVLTAPRYSFGIPLCLLFAAGIIFSAFKREKADILILFWIAVFYVFISLTSSWQVLRWQLPYVPFLCILAARFIISAADNGNKLISRGIAVLSAFVLILTLFYTTAYVKTMAVKDVRDVSSEWIEQNIPEGSTIGSPCVCFWNPSIVMTEFWYKDSEPFYKGLKRYKMIQVPADPAELDKLDPDYIILTDFEYHPLLKIKYLYPHPETYPFLLGVMNEGKYTFLKSFENKPELFGIKPVNGFYPHELRMVFPEIRIYKKAGK
ncbi:MAG: glycosyltransferase family 39 protein [Elusimicrobiota bacterium]